jgi:hypothetical protein
MIGNQGRKQGGLMKLVLRLLKLDGNSPLVVVGSLMSLLVRVHGKWRRP